MKYAIIRTGGQQFKVQEGDILDLNLLPEAKKTLTFKEVLLFVDGDKVKIGQPLVKEATVKAKIIEPQLKGPKLKIMRFKAKSRYRKRRGHRQAYTRVEIVSLSLK